MEIINPGNAGGLDPASQHVDGRSEQQGPGRRIEQRRADRGNDQAYGAAPRSEHHRHDDTRADDRLQAEQREAPMSATPDPPQHEDRSDVQREGMTGVPEIDGGRDQRPNRNERGQRFLSSQFTTTAQRAGRDGDRHVWRIGPATRQPRSSARSATSMKQVPMSGCDHPRLSQIESEPVSRR
jgi:hypothetical protein